MICKNYRHDNSKMIIMIVIMDIAIIIIKFVFKFAVFTIYGVGLNLQIKEWLPSYFIVRANNCR